MSMYFYAIDNQGSMLHTYVFKITRWKRNCGWRRRKRKKRSREIGRGEERKRGRRTRKTTTGQ